MFGFIQCLDGEKDPRNLLLAFTLIKKIIQEFDIAQHVEVAHISTSDGYGAQIGVMLTVLNGTVLGPVRGDILLLPNYIQATPRRSLWNYIRPSEDRFARLSLSNTLLCQVCVTTAS